MTVNNSRKAEESLSMEGYNGGLEGSKLSEQDGRTGKEGVYFSRRRGTALKCLRTKLEIYLTTLSVLLALICLALIILVIVTRKEMHHSASKNSNVCLTHNCVQTAAQLLEGIDPMADPCEDFFQFACGSWNKKHIIPDDKPSFNTFEKLTEDLQHKLKRLLEEPVNSEDTRATTEAKILYSSCINTTQIELVGDGPLRAMIKDLGLWPVMQPDWSASGWSLEQILARVRGDYNAPILIKMDVATDDKNSSVRIIQLDQPSLGLPSPEFYDPDNLDAYLEYMVGVASLLGANEANARTEMAQVVEFERRLANITSPKSERYDTVTLYKKMTLGELQTEIPEISWLRYFDAVMGESVSSDEMIVSFGMQYMRDMAKMVAKESKRVLANYLIWRLVMGLVPELTKDYLRYRNEFRQVIHGVSRENVRWDKCVSYVNERMGLAVGRLFIKENFRKKSKEAALEMIHNIREAFNEILEENEWMDDATKALAKEKANAINDRIGYPDYILDAGQLDEIYEGLSFDKDKYFENVLSLEKHESRRGLAKLREPIDKDKWEQSPAVVNAFYNPNTNDIVIPAGILQPLFYSEFFPKSVNYGGIGVVIGHEITHGFDDKGRLYDRDGNMRQWWNNETIQAFKDRAQCFIDQYSDYILKPFNLTIDGKITQGENIADNGGLKESFRAYKKWVEKHGEEQTLPGMNMSHNQLFFLNYAQIWCGIMRDKEAVLKIRTSVHSPGPIRVLGALSNSPDFASAYKCPVGSIMNPTKICSLW